MKCLSILLALLLTLSICACDKSNADDAPTVPDDTSAQSSTPATLSMLTLEEAEKVRLKELLESTDNHAVLDLPKATGSVEVVHAIKIPCAFSTVPDEIGQEYTNGILAIYDERELYPEATGEYVYVMFGSRETASTAVKRTLLSVTCEENTLKLNIGKGPGIEDADYSENIYVLKIKKSSLDASINKLEVTFETLSGVVA